MAGADPPELAGRWRTTAVLKRDVLSTIERGRFATPAGEVDAVLRRVDQVPWWTAPVARHFLRREARALRLAGPLGIAPTLLHAGRLTLVRSWIDGTPLQVARPTGEPAYFRSAREVLRRLRRAGLCHNDLAKEQNWLRGRDGKAYLTDFQLSIHFARRGRLFRVAAYEDLRHLLKHKRRYAPAALTAAERRMLARKSWIARGWLATGKRAYAWLTRRVLRIADREGAGARLADAGPLAAALRRHPQVRDVAVVPFPRPQAGSGLYAFVETDAAEAELRAFLARAAPTARPPEHMQVVAALPRDANGAVRAEWLTLIAMDQVDLLGALSADPAEQQILSRIAAERRTGLALDA